MKIFDSGKPTSSQRNVWGECSRRWLYFVDIVGMRIDGSGVINGQGQACSLKDAQECRRYSGYCAWRGVLDFSENENSDTMMSIRKAYPDLGKCLYFDLSSGDDCIAIKGGTQFLEVSQVICGPGHGISKENAIVLDCAKIGCNHITLSHINITPIDPAKPASTICKNVQGTAKNVLPYVPCLH
ncbi:hypothetical protein RIF29_27182 [Crotalaria pallida]|uniref:Uncharacterized protein n=1 Tax=Crotalaria pallida TaxID=3830 RepID=A0AAN9EVU5_CROPI